jgi:hypothetical protein
MNEYARWKQTNCLFWLSNSPCTLEKKFSWIFRVVIEKLPSDRER